MARKRRHNAYTAEGKPRYVRIYDNGGETLDRYTAVFSRLNCKVYPYLAMSEKPYSPLGFCQHGEGEYQHVDRPRYGHLGKKITFDDLNEACQRAVMEDYVAYWGPASAQVGGQH